MPMDLRAWAAERLERTYRDGNWAGSGVLPALRDVTLDEAHWRPAPEQHTIAEIALHVAYWCWMVAYRLDPGSTAKPGEDWQPVAPTPEAWQRVLEGLEGAHAACAAAIRAADPARLDEPIPDSPWAVRDVVADIATHDSYHAAQIFVLRRLYAART